mmetsp:Transcript_17228/g.20510  ORF Transcript_17228/g.20510 Transcript_17228/m.20510 type:complete len:96 (-) Transcript_17228:93-380(-)
MMFALEPTNALRMIYHKKCKTQYQPQTSESPRYVSSIVGPHVFPCPLAFHHVVQTFSISERILPLFDGLSSSLNDASAANEFLILTVFSVLLLSI